MNTNFETRKHWISYLILTLGYVAKIIGLILVLFFLMIIVFANFKNREEELIRIARIAVEHWDWINSSIIIISTIILLKYIYDLVYLRSIRWIVDSQGVTYKEGILPWNRKGWFWSYSQIYQCGYNWGFLGWLFNYGEIHIIGKEGTTSRTVFFRVAKVKRLAEEISRHIH